MDSSFLRVVDGVFLAEMASFCADDASILNTSETARATTNPDAVLSFLSRVGTPAFDSKAAGVFVRLRFLRRDGTGLDGTCACVIYAASLVVPSLIILSFVVLLSIASSVF